MQQHWDLFHSVAQHGAHTQRARSTIPRQALQRAWLNRRNRGYSAKQVAWLSPRPPPHLPECLAPLCCRARWLDYHTSRVHLELSFLGHLKWHSASQRELSVTPKAWPGKEPRRGGVGEEARSRREAKEEEEAVGRLSQDPVRCREPRAKRWQNEGKGWEGKGEGEAGEEEQREEWSPVKLNPSHMSLGGWMVRHAGNIYKHTVDVTL